MDSESFQAYLTNRYEEQKDWYDQKASFNQKRYKKWTLVVIILSAVTPVMAALEAPIDDNRVALTVKVILVLISSVVAIGTTILKTFRYQELWTTYRETAERLRTEKYLFDAQLGVYSQITPDLKSLFVDQVESILSKEHSRWVSTSQMTQGSSGAAPVGVQPVPDVPTPLT